MKKRKTKSPSRNEAPLIGITPDRAAGRPGVSGNQAEPLLVLQERYTRAIQEAGGVPLILPIGASGARILTTLLYALDDLKLKRGLASLCIGGGEGVSLVVEKI